MTRYHGSGDPRHYGYTIRRTPASEVRWEAARAASRRRRNQRGKPNAKDS